MQHLKVFHFPDLGPEVFADCVDVLEYSGCFREACELARSKQTRVGLTIWYNFGIEVLPGDTAQALADRLRGSTDDNARLFTRLILDNPDPSRKIEIIRQDAINEVIIMFAGQPARIVCDRNCRYAWGIDERPRRADGSDEFLPDSEAGEAPVSASTSEGADDKPDSPDQFPTRWCVRRCERSNLSPPGGWNKVVPLRMFNDN